MTRIISSLIAIFILYFQVNAQSVFLKYDANCMDRLEYSAGDALNPYVSYSLKLGGNSFMIFDIGKEDVKWQRDLPGKLAYCNTLTFDRSLVNQINNGSVKLYIVRESPAQYQVTAVDKASFFAQQGNAIQFLMEDTEFLMHTDNLVSQVNLALPNAQKEVYLAGTLKMQCLTGYIIQKKEGARSAGFKEYVLIPELGIVERSSASGYASLGETVRSGVLKLNRIGNVTLQDAASIICDRLQATYYDGAPRETLVVKTGEIPVSYDNDPCAPSTVAGIHVVQKGETMYGISRRYGISLDQIRVWNNMQNTDLLAICQKLYVKDPTSVSGSTGTATATTGTATSTTLTEKSGATGYWMNAPEVHVVRPGESVAGLAFMFGYTEERFRKMNAMSPAENIYVGQKLRTSDCVCPTLASTTKDQPLPYEAETEKLTSKGNPDVYFRPVKIHQVKKEDTLFSIAKLYDTSVERILELNGMKKGDKISTNQRLYVQ
jgi:LysM repeat protein